MKKLYKRAAFLLLLGMMVQLLSGCGGSSLAAARREESIDLSSGLTAAPSRGELERISENDRFILYANLSNGEAAVKDKRSGETWYTNPVDKSEDGLASGFHKNALQSVLTVVYTTAQSVDMTCGGFMSSVRKDGLYYRLEPDGSVIFLFDFPGEEFYIPVHYSIGENCFKAKILTESILEYGTNTIKTIDFLPFFGAGGRTDEGYMLVPDGSGALIYYNNNRLTANTYSKALYGFDNGTNDKVMGGAAAAGYFTLSENQYLPVFGVSRNDQGYLAVISQGAARAAVNANIAYKYTLYNTVWTTYSYRTFGSVRQTQKDGSEVVTNVGEKKLETWQDYEVSFYFLETGKNTYSDMAAAYREMLFTDEEKVSMGGGHSDIPLYLDLYGYIKKTKSFLGIPMEKKIAMTTVDDVNAMLDALSLSGIDNVVVKYNYWAKDSYFGKVPTTSAVDGTVGSAAQLRALQERLAGDGGALFLSADLLNIYKTGNGVSQYGDVLRNVANTAQRQYKFSLASAMIDSRYDPWYLLRPTAIGGVFQKFADELTKAGYENLALDSAGEMLYSELSTSGVGRNQMVDVMRGAVGSVAGSARSLMVTGANDYAAAQAAHILRSPSKASNYDIEDVSVPFYQMVFHGYAAYSLSEVNLASNPADTTLKYLEYGAYPLFSLIGQNADELIGSRMDNLYSADAANWMDFLAAQYAQLNEALGSVQDSTMTEHRILSENVRAVTYENGLRIYVNYGSASAAADGIELQPKGYAVVLDGRVLVNARAADN